MYFAKTNPSFDFVIYKSLLDQYLENNQDQDVKQLFDSIIIATHKVVLGEVQVSKIDHKIFNLVNALSDENKKFTRDYFATINPQNIGTDQLRTLRGILYSLATA